MFFNENPIVMRYFQTAHTNGVGVWFFFAAVTVLGIIKAYRWSRDTFHLWWYGPPPEEPEEEPVDPATQTVEELEQRIGLPETEAAREFIHHKGICAVCHKKDEGMLSCKLCKQVWYCGPTCQECHWKAKENPHKPICKAIRKRRKTEAKRKKEAEEARRKKPIPWNQTTIRDFQRLPHTVPSLEVID